VRLAWEQSGLVAGLAWAGVDVHHGPHYTMPVLAPVPTVVTIHDLTFVEHPEWHEPAKVPVFRTAIAVARRRAAVVVCVSDATARRLTALGPVHGPVVVAPHGVDHDRFRPDTADPAGDDALRRALGIRPPYLLFLGTIEPRKQVDVLVRAFDRLAADHPELTLVLAGRDGWGQGSVLDALAHSAARGRVVLTGYVPDAVVPALLRGAAAVCYPAAEEGFGLPALEAVACGAPLVTTAGSVMAEVVGEAAVTAPVGSPDALAEAVRRALAGGPAAVRRRRVGLAVAAAHTWSASAEAHVRAYRLAAEQARRHHAAVGARRRGR
jgi:glycosyltransferase involved in cell wall biosynthesis